jgi:hypothetical protein
VPSDIDNNSKPAKRLSRWHELGTEQQTRLLVEYGHYLDTLPPTCSLDKKNERFARWLAEKGISYAVG